MAQGRSRRQYGGGRHMIRGERVVYNMRDKRLKIPYRKGLLVLIEHACNARQYINQW